MQERNAQMDRNTSGTFDPRALEKWVRVLQAGAWTAAHAYSSMGL